MFLSKKRGSVEGAESQATATPKQRKLFKSRKSLIIFIVACVLVIALVAFGLHKFVFSSGEAVSATTDARVVRGSIVNVIEGSGTIEAKAQYEVKYLSSVDVIADYFEEGDYVDKDQILYQMDAEDIDRNIIKQQRNVEKARMNYNEALESVADLNVKSDIDGVVTNLYVSKGDNVSNGAKIADVIDKNTLVLTLPFVAEEARSISVGDGAEVTISDSKIPLYGKVTNVGSGTQVNSYGVEVIDVEIEAKNPAAVGEGKMATAVVGNYACCDTGSIEYANKKTILAKTSGEVGEIVSKKGDAVYAGSTIVRLTSDNSDKTVKEARFSLDDAQSSLDQLLESKDDATIRSEIAGKVIQKNIKAGEILDSNSSSTMAIIADLSSLKFSISIDELDISKISVGQEVTITADALSGRTFKGSVTNVSIVGSAFQGVTSYPVTVTIDNTRETELIPGMNVEAQIVIDSVSDVLKVPVSALRMGSYVIVKDDGTFADPLKMEIPAMGGRPGEDTRDKTEEKSGDELRNKAEKTQEGNDTPDTPPSGINGPNGVRSGGFAGQNGPGAGGQYPGNAGNSPRGQINPDGEEKAETASGQTEKKAVPGENNNSHNNGNQAMSAADEEERKKQMQERMKSMIESLDVPEGYTVVRVQTGINDGSFVEIKEIKGSLKEGDTVLIPAVINTGAATGQMGGMPGGMGGGMPGGMTGARPAGMGGMTGNRTGGMGGMTGNRTGGMR